MIDTHTHLYLNEFSDGGDETVVRAIASGVGHLILPNVDASTMEPMKALHSRFPKNPSVPLALHPTEVGEGWEAIVDDMEKELMNGGYVAVGEVGVDLYWDKSRRDDQLKAFARQLRIASRLHLPVIIHCREALADTVQVISEVKPEAPLVFHSFTGSKEDVKLIREACSPMFGINGVVTFKNAASLREAIPEIGLQHVLLETDSPYLAPVPNRGKRNESSFLCCVRDKVAEVLGISPDEVEHATDCSAREIFKI